AVVLQHGEVDDAHPDDLAQPGERHAARGEQLVEPAVDAGGLVVVRGPPRTPSPRHHTRPSVSRCIRAPSWKASATTASATPTPIEERSRSSANVMSPSPATSTAPPPVASGPRCSTRAALPAARSTWLPAPPTMMRTALVTSAVVTEIG